MSPDSFNKDSVVIERGDRILVMTINRPHAKNAVDAAVSRALADATDLLDSDPALSVGIVTGAGGRSAPESDASWRAIFCNRLCREVQ